MRRCVLAAGVVATLVAGAAPAFAQYYGGYGGGGYGGYDGPRYRRPHEEDYGYRRYGPPPDRRLSRVCVTSRGSCPSYPAPISSPCRCDIPGFGPKRGNIGG